MERTTTRVGGHQLSAFEAGEGRPLVLLHAFPVHAGMWQPQLERPPAGWRLIAPDLRGFGRSPHHPQERALSLDDHAEDVLGLLDARRIERAVVCGLSMGGYIAFAVHRAAPSRIDALVLVDTRAEGDTDEAREGRRGMQGLVAREGSEGAARSMIPKMLGKDTLASRPELVDTVRELILANPPAAIHDALEALMSRPDSTPWLPRIECPTLIVVGEQDVLTPPSVAESMARHIPRASVVRIPGAGHLPSLEAPEAFGAALAGFLSSLPERPA